VKNKDDKKSRRRYRTYIYISVFLGGRVAQGVDPTKAPPPCGVKFGAGMLSRGISSVGRRPPPFILLQQNRFLIWNHPIRKRSSVYIYFDENKTIFIILDPLQSVHNSVEQKNSEFVYIFKIVLDNNIRYMKENLLCNLHNEKHKI
jgi:hypothetical protein